MTLHLSLPTLDEITAATTQLQQQQICSSSYTTNHSIQLKLDQQLPGGSYKIRGVTIFLQHMAAVDEIPVLSAGNLALALAICLRATATRCIAIVPQGISSIKRDSLSQLDARLIEMAFSSIWEQVQDASLWNRNDYLHPFNKWLLCGYASIVAELKQSNITYGSLVVPYGLGGLAVALAHALEVYALNIKLYVCEITDYAPFQRARLQADISMGKKLISFIEAMGTPQVVPAVFAYLQPRVQEVITVTEEQVKLAIQTAYNQFGIRIEGAAGAALAAANKLSREEGPIIAIMTGANIAADIFATIIA